MNTNYQHAFIAKMYVIDKHVKDKKIRKKPIDAHCRMDRENNKEAMIIVIDSNYAKN